MNYTREKLIEQVEAGEHKEYLFFWGHQPLKNGQIGSSCFSQWWNSEFEIKGIRYKTAEHYMMAEKARLFDDKVAERAILACETPGEAKKWGRKVSNFIPEVWEKNCYEIVKNGNRYKFEQNESLKHFLLKTKRQVLVEASPVDFIWGIGLAADNPKVYNPKKWNGLNLLGFVLMEVRDEIFQTTNNQQPTTNNQ